MWGPTCAKVTLHPWIANIDGIRHTKRFNREHAAISEMRKDSFRRGLIYVDHTHKGDSEAGRLGSFELFWAEESRVVGEAS